MIRTHHIAAAALALLGTSAFAGGEFDPLTGFGPVQSTVSRADVRAQVAEARSAGTLGGTREDRMFDAAVAGSSLSRAEVRTELARARAEGSNDSFDVGTNYAQAPKTPSTLTREQVREETRLARGVRRGVQGS